MQINYELLGNTPLFGGIEESEIEKMLDCLGATKRTYLKDEYIINAGDKVDSFGLLLSGKVTVMQEDFWGNRNIFARINQGHLFAETMACSSECESSVSVVAESDCEVLFMNVNRILKTCPTACTYHSQIIQNLLIGIAHKSMKLNEKITHMSKRTTKDKLMSYLSEMSRKSGSSKFDIPFDRQELADYLCVERSAMSYELGRLRDAGIIEFNRNHFKLIN